MTVPHDGWSRGMRTRRRSCATSTCTSQRTSATFSYGMRWRATPVEGRAAGMRDQGVVSRILRALTGRNQKLSADNQMALAEGQYALLRLINAVQRQGALSLEFSCVLQNRLQAAYQEMARLGQRHNDDL